MTAMQAATFAVRGTSIFINNSSIPVPVLPAGTFTIENNPQTGLYFEQVPDLKSVSRLYGDIQTRADRVMSTYADRDTNTGILLSGEKGSGKTLLARLLSERCRTELGMPTIMLTMPYPGSALISFLKSVTQPYILFIDEFEKMYSGDRGHEDEGQHSLLSLFDGGLDSKRMTIVTCNDIWKISGYLQNRPGRFYYHFKYYGLDEAFIREYCVENLNNKDNAEGVVMLAAMFVAFNFDMLQAIVEEMNRYDEKASQAMKYLNILPEKESISWEIDSYEIPPAMVTEMMEENAHSIEHYSKNYKNRNGREPAVKIEPKIYNHGGLSPLLNDIEISYCVYVGTSQVECESYTFEPGDVVSFSGGMIEYYNDAAGKLVLKRVVRRTYSTDMFAF